MTNKTPFPIMINAALVSAQNRKRLFWTNIPGVTLPKDRGILMKDIIHETRGEDFDLDKYIIKSKFYREKGLDYKFSEEPHQEKATALRATDYKGTHNIIARGLAYRNRGKGKMPEVGGDKANAMTTVRTDSMVRVASLNSGGQGDRIYSIEGKSVCLSAHGGGRGAKCGLYRIPTKAKVLRVGGKGCLVDDRHCWDAYHFDGYDRKITPIECERLQSLPDGYTEGVSNTQRYTTLGNAFNCEVVKHILKNII